MSPRIPSPLAAVGAVLVGALATLLVAVPAHAATAVAYVAMGDSYSAGLGLEDPRDAWPTVAGRLEGWQTYVEAVSGTGVTTGGPCTGQDFGARLPQALAHDPETLIVGNATSLPLRMTIL